MNRAPNPAAPPSLVSRRALVAVVLAAAGIVVAIGVVRGNASAPREVPAPAVAAKPAPIDVEVDVAAAAPDADVAAIARRFEDDVRAAITRKAAIEDGGAGPLVTRAPTALPGVAEVAVRCADASGSGGDCDPRAMAVEGWDAGVYPVPGHITVRVAIVDTIADRNQAGRAARAILGTSLAGADARTKLAVARLAVLLARGYDEADREAALAGRRDDDAESARHHALARYQIAATITREILAARSDDAEGALRDPAQLDAWLRAHVKDEADAPLLLWAGAAHAGKARLDTGAEAAEPRAVAEKLLLKARALGRGATWDLATMELASLHAQGTPPKLDAAQALFEEALRKSPHGSPLVRVAYATEVACRKGDGALHGKLLAEAQRHADPDPLRRWEIAIAAELAKRAGTEERWQRCRDGVQ
ncbi:MAG: TRAP transporter TatT component family protein [Minicystis sp.]